MKKMRSLLSLLLALLLCFSLFACDGGESPSSSSSSSSSSVTPPSPPTPVEQIAQALDASFEKIGTEILFNEEYDTEADYALSYEEIRTLLSACDYNVYKLKSVETLYKTYFIGEFKEITALSDAIVHRMINAYKMAMVTANEATLTKVLVACYLYAVGDKYAVYFAPEDIPTYEEDVSGTYSGIGVSVMATEDGYVEVLNVFPGAPAIEAGLMPGDIFVAVEGEDVAEIGYYVALEKMRGEVGTEVSFTILRDGQRIDMTVTRATVTTQVVYHDILDGNVGYIRITSFDDNTYSQFVSAYEELEASGVESIIFDMRSNPGGLIVSVVAILEYILPAGDIVKLHYKTADYTIQTVLSLVPSSYPDYNAFLQNYLYDHKIDLPMVVLTNDYTVSAAELFTAALRDYDDRGYIDATIVGENTYGKGAGQSAYENMLAYNAQGDTDGSIIRITTFGYAPPFTSNYEGVGIAPDILVELSEEAQRINLYKLTYEQDAQLQAAHNYLKK